MRWFAPIFAAKIELIFDTGLHRILTLTHADGYATKMKWGEAQPETVRDYQLEGEVEDSWVQLASITGNFQRRAIHTFTDPQLISALRVIITAANGHNQAHIFEVRVYERDIQWLNDKR